MDFTPKDMTVKNLFRSFTQFKIPVFQRDYSWDKQYYSKFIDDIISGISLSDGELKGKTYFIGTMVLSGKNDEQAIDVVDGQQRLTVITILLSVISEKLLSIKEVDVAKATFKYVKEQNDNAEYIAHLVSDTSYPYLDSFIQSLDKVNAISKKTEEEDNLEETYEYFSERLLEDKLKENEIFGEISYKNILVAIRDQILASVLIVITTPDRDNAYKIFEILNAKGKNLASIDLIKNIVFEELHGDESGGQGVAEERWEGIKNNLRTRGQNIGLATFYRHYWISKYKKVTNAKLYDSFKENIKKNKKQEYLNFLKDIEEESKTYIKIIKPNLSEDFDNRQEYKWLVQSLKALNDTFGVIQTRLALLALFDVKSKGNISTKKFKEAIIYIENFVFMHTGIAKRPANIYEGRFSSLAIALRKSKSKEGTNIILNELLYEKFKDRELNFYEFENGFVELTFKKGKDSSNTVAKYIIQKLSSSYQDQETFLEHNSIEHIINENSNEPKSINIGNLINLEETYNNDADNSEYTEKIESYKKSKNIQVKKFIEHYEKFTVDDIDERAKEMAKYYYENILGKKIN